MSAAGARRLERLVAVLVGLVVFLAPVTIAIAALALLAARASATGSELFVRPSTLILTSMLVGATAAAGAVAGWFLTLRRLRKLADGGGSAAGS